MIAVQRAGMVSTGSSPLLTQAELPHQLNDSEAKLIMAIVLRAGFEKSEGEKEILFMDELPTSGVGKILKREIRKMLSVQL